MHAITDVPLYVPVLYPYGYCTYLVSNMYVCLYKLLHALALQYVGHVGVANLP
jgi:hypothetical protein